MSIVTAYSVGCTRVPARIQEWRHCGVRTLRAGAGSFHNQHAVFVFEDVPDQVRADTPLVSDFRHGPVLLRHFEGFCEVSRCERTFLRPLP